MRKEVRGRPAKSPWAGRIWDLGGALGLNQGELGQLLGFACNNPLSRVLNGGKPTVQFLLRLEKLEAVYAGEIEEFIASNRPFKRNRRRTLETRGAAITTRPADIAEVGMVAPVGTPSSAAIRAEQRAARSKAKALASQRRFNEKNRKAKIRRSQTFRRQLYNLAFGTKRISGQRVKSEIQNKEETNGA